MASDNPYRDNLHNEGFGYDEPGEVAYGPDGGIILPPGQRRGMVGHVVVVGWLLFVQGIFELLLGVILVAVALLLPDFVAEQAQNNPAVGNSSFTPEQLRFIVLFVYGVMGLALLVIGPLSIFGGWKMTRFRSHTLGVVALSGGFFTLFGGCYCFPTALAIGVYGLIVLLNDVVKTAFAIGAQGYTARQIKDAFRDLPP